MTGKDLDWIDYAKVIGIFLVVFGHVLQGQIACSSDNILKLLWDYIYLFHMPLFFMISGFLYKEINQLGGKSLILKLILPYFLYQIIFLPASIVIHKEFLDSPFAWFKMVAGVFLGDGYDSDYSFYDCIPCWFIVCTIQLRLLFCTVRMTHYSASFLVLFSCFFLYFRRILDFDLLFCLDSTIMAIPYFILGYYFKRLKHIDSYPYLIYCCIAVFSLILCYVILELNGAAQMNGPSYGKFLLLNYTAGIIGSISVLSISCLISRLIKISNGLKVISRNTLFIIFSHWVFVSVFSFIGLHSFMSGISNNHLFVISGVILESLLILVLSYFLIRMLGTKFPLLLGKQKA